MNAQAEITCLRDELKEALEEIKHQKALVAIHEAAAIRNLGRLYHVVLRRNLLREGGRR
jgi:hypothetical protein